MVGKELRNLASVGADSFQGNRKAIFWGAAASLRENSLKLRYREPQANTLQ